MDKSVYSPGGAAQSARSGPGADPSALLWRADPERDRPAAAHDPGADLPAGAEDPVLDAGPPAGIAFFQPERPKDAQKQDRNLVKR